MLKNARNAEFYFKANDLKKTLEYYSKSCKLNDAKGCVCCQQHFMMVL